MKYSLHRWENSSGGGKHFNVRAFVLGQEISYHIPYSAKDLNSFESLKLSNFAWSKQILVIYFFINFPCQIIWLFWGGNALFFLSLIKAFIQTVIWWRFSSLFIHCLFFIHPLSLFFFLFTFCKRKKIFKYKEIWKLIK